MIGIVERRDIADRRRIEDRHIGDHAGPQNAAIGEADACGGTRRHFSYRVLERQQMLVAHVLAENPGERSPAARVRLRTRERAIGRYQAVSR